MILWVLADDRAGNVAQAVGVAEATGRPFITKEIRYTPWARLPNILRGASLLGLTKDSRAAVQQSPPPDLVLAAGRRTAPVARWLKRHYGARLVQIMDPGWGGREDFDLIAIPSHDRHSVTGPAVLPITGAPHRVTAERLATARQQWQPYWQAQAQPLPRPWLGVIVGGATKNHPFDAAMAESLAAHCAAFQHQTGGSVLLTTSRRTGPVATAVLKQRIAAPCFLHLWGETARDNPYFGLLATADALLVTGDSVSMCSEACAAAAPVYLFAPDGRVSAKHARLHHQLYTEGYARPATELLPFRPLPHPPLNAAETIVAALRQRGWLESRANSTPQRV